MKLTKSKLKQIVKEELKNILKEGHPHDYDRPSMDPHPPNPHRAAAEVGEAERLGFVDPYDDSLRKLSGMRRYKDWVDKGRPPRLRAEETVDEAGPYSTSAARPAGPSYTGRTSANPTGVFYIGAPYTGTEYDTFEAADAAARPGDRIYDSEGNWEVKI